MLLKIPVINKILINNNINTHYNTTNNLITNGNKIKKPITKQLIK